MNPSPDPTALLTARAAAERAARAAGVTIRELHDLDTLAEAGALLDRVWPPTTPGGTMITPELLLVLAHSGSYVAGVHQDDRLIGTCLGLLAAVGLHSHVAVVEGGTRGRSIGYAVKLHQRAWALERSIATITWTYDPLVSRNAYFNLAKLGALPAEYLADFYGPMQDEVNAGDASDRLLVRWELAAERVELACAGRPHTIEPDGLRSRAVVALDMDERGGPTAGRSDGVTLLVRVPPDIEALRRRDPRAARDWRHALREVLAGLLAERCAVTGFARDGWYLVERPES